MEVGSLVLDRESEQFGDVHYNFPAAAAVAGEA
jgi:hypothetical protein